MDSIVIPPVPAGFRDSSVDFPYIFNSAGWHNLRIEHDYHNSLDEQYEFNNACEETVFVRCDQGYAIGEGRGVLGVVQRHIDTYCVDSGYFELSDEARKRNNANLLGHNHNGRMYNPINTYRWVPGPNYPMRDSDNTWDSPSQAAGVDAHVYAGLSYDYVLHTLQRNGFIDSFFIMRSFVDVNIPSLFKNTNALFSDTLQAVLYSPAIGGEKSFAGNLGAVAHEWAHGITAHTSQLHISGESGSLNESFSNMFGASVKFASLGVASIRLTPAKCGFILPQEVSSDEEASAVHTGV